MKIVNKTDFTNTINLPIKTIGLQTDNEKNVEFFLNKVQDVNKYKVVIDKNIKNNGKRYKISEMPMEISGVVEPTELINKLYKDIYIRYQTIAGNVVDHELSFVTTIESQELESKEEQEKDNDKKKLTKKKDTKKEQSLVKLRHSNNIKLENDIQLQIQEINNLGTIIDYRKNNLTEFENEFRDKILDAFLMLYKKDKIHKELRPLHWCTKCSNSVKKSDIKYENSKWDLNYILYKVKNDNGALGKYNNLENTYFVATTAYPWQLISSKYIAIAKDVEYSLVEVFENNKKFHYIIATDQVIDVMEMNFFVKYEKKDVLKNSDLKKIICMNPLFKDKEISVVETDSKYVFWCKKKGTGITAISTGNNFLDYLVLKSVNKLDELLNTVDVKGNISIVSDLNNLIITYKEAEEKVLERLKELNLIYSSEKIDVKVQKCGICDEKLTYRLISRWYINKNDIQDDMKNHKEKLNLLAEKMYSSNSYKNKEYLNVIEKINNIKELVISDEKVVGTPIPTFYCGNCGKQILSDLSISVIKKLLQSKGIEQWHKLTPEEILKGEVACECGCGFFFKDDSTLNDFFGVVASVLIDEKEKKEEDICKISIESKDTFYEKLLAISFSSDIEDELKLIDSIMVHSNLDKIKDEKNSIKNIINKYGLDVFRLWTISNMKKSHINLNEQSVINEKFNYLSIRRTFKFLLANLSGFNPPKHKVELSKRNDLDKVMYKNLQEFLRLLNSNYEKLEFDKVYENLIKFCKKDLCKDYFEASKYNLYMLDANDIKRRSVQSTMFDILMSLVVFVEPLIPFTVEEIWPFIWHKDSVEASNVLLYELKQEQLEGDYEEETKRWKTIYYMRDRIETSINKAKKNNIIKNNIEAKVIINTKEKQKEFIEKNYNEILKTSGVSLIEVNITAKASMIVEKAPGTQCARCKEYNVSIGRDLKYRYLCPDCAKTLHELDKNV